MMKIALVMVMVMFLCGAEASIGINWGRESAQRLVPSQVVDLLLQNGIGRARLYSAQTDIVAAFEGSGINLTITINNPSAIKSRESATAWIKAKEFYFNRCNIKSIFLFGYVFLNGMKGGLGPLIKALESQRLLQDVLNERGFGHIKVNFPHIDMELVSNVTKPSESDFYDIIKPHMIQHLQFLRENNAPFQVESIPIINAALNNFDPSFAFPGNASTQVIKDTNGAVYTNIVEWQYDSYVWALEKLNFSDIRVDYSMLGWPTDGYTGANFSSAEYFYKHLLPWVSSDKGTPKRPGHPINVNVHSLTDEHKMLLSYPFARHWGIYRSNGQPKYKIDLSGQGRDMYPTTVRGIMHMPNRWCAFNGERRDIGKVRAQLERACIGSDCTSTYPGASCSSLTFEQNITYAFNMYFQFQFQDEKSCDFEGLGHVVVNDPSTDACVFPVEVVKGQQVNFMPKNSGRAFRPSTAFFCFSIFLFFYLSM
ncbi:glucan endo-1,3-beta-glucosidase 8-like [Salvia hispanica]|uniref:glucan endo-1,3-beta-glucosidase 8-like n=1 Tax=Salvia hispanica TaxID=49212 RepID=UPI002009CCBD|nr:glucan endo-1,3-beta-glucosidase 8-like [Salvia hispanica]